MGRIVALPGPLKPATKKEMRERLALYERDLERCRKDLKSRPKNGNPSWMPNAVTVLHNECKRRIAYYEPAIKELKWALGVE
jgi:hypothetical protein